MPPSIGLGESIPPDTAHAVSVSLPTWSANVGYEEGQPWVVSKLTTGYPRFFIHKAIQAFANDIAERYGLAGQVAMLYSSRRAAARCLALMQKLAASPSVLDGTMVVHLGLDVARPDAAPFRPLAPTISAVIMHPEAFPLAKQYWQHTGDGVSSRRAEYCHKLYSEGLLVRQPDVANAATAATAATAAAAAPVPTDMKPFRGPKRYRRPMSPTTAAVVPERPRTAQSPSAQSPPSAAADTEVETDETALYLEERFGRNLDLSFVQRAKQALRRRITGALTADDDVEEAPASKVAAAKPANIRGSASVIHEEDVYLLPCGMNAIYNAHRYLLAARPDRAHLRSINFGFPYVDTLKILQKFGAGCLFYGHASEADLDDLEARLRGGERFLALFCEFPGNPLLTCPNLTRIRALADAYDFSVVVDETIGTFANINVMPHADVVVSSLTKIFSGDCNVMGGSLVLNRQGRHYAALHAAAADGGPDGDGYDPDGYWPEDVIFMERNSRDFAERVDRINANAEALCDILRASPLVRIVYYPKYGRDAANYEAVRIGGAHEHCGAHHLRPGGYGGLLSFVFHHKAQAVAFFDAVETAKGPSLGTNFTLTSPYVILAHFQELAWCAELGIDPDLVRVSVGLEDTDALRKTFETALAAAAAVAVEEKKE